VTCRVSHLWVRICGALAVKINSLMYHWYEKSLLSEEIVAGLRNVYRPYLLVILTCLVRGLVWNVFVDGLARSEVWPGQSLELGWSEVLCLTWVYERTCPLRGLPWQFDDGVTGLWWIEHPLPGNWWHWCSTIRPSAREVLQETLEKPLVQLAWT
jgi:hypothetical protein